MSDYSPPPVAEQRVLIAVLKAARILDTPTNILLLATSLSLGLMLANEPAKITTVMLLLLALVLGMVAKWFALRLRLDHALFKDMLAEPSAITSIDRGIARLTGTPPPQQTRTYEDRAQATLSLFRKMVIVIALQGMALGLAALLSIETGIY